MTATVIATWEKPNLQVALAEVETMDTIITTTATLAAAEVVTNRHPQEVGQLAALPLRQETQTTEVAQEEAINRRGRREEAEEITIIVTGIGRETESLSTKEMKKAETPHPAITIDMTQVARLLRQEMLRDLLEATVQPTRRHPGLEIPVAV
jgi:hypothetical protein